MRDGGAPLDNKFSTGASGGSQREIEYSVGRRVEQVVAVPGSIRRIQVVAVVPKSLDEAQMERIKNVVAAAVGASRERGDTVVVQPLNAFGAGDVAAGNHAATGEGDAHDDADRSAAMASTGIVSSVSDRTSQLVLLLLVLLLAAVSIFGIAGLRGRRKAATGAAALSEEQREAVLLQIRTWMQEPSAASGASSKAKT
jgi:flagellar M-ring protein FliF